MKKSIQKVLVVAAVVATLMMSLVPGASANSRDTNNQTYEATAQTEHEICRIEGANICPPEPFEIVLVCITTSMLAGSTCPDMSDATVGGAAKLVAPGDDGTSHALPTGDCSGVAECNDFIAECVGAGGKYVPEHDNEKGQPNLGSCGEIS